LERWILFRGEKQDDLGWSGFVPKRLIPKIASTCQFQ